MKPGWGRDMARTESFHLTPDEFAQRVRSMVPLVRSPVGSHTLVGFGEPGERYARVRLVLLGHLPSDEDAPDPVPESAALGVLFKSAIRIDGLRPYSRVL